VIGNAIANQQDEWWEMSAKTHVLNNYEMDYLRARGELYIDWTKYQGSDR
jgi:hypothetical protein